MNLRETIFALAQSYRVHIKEAVNANELGLNGMHVRCLHAIANCPQCTANAIVNQLGKDKAQIARLIKDMLDKGWLEKHSSEFQPFVRDRGLDFCNINILCTSLQSMILSMGSETRPVSWPNKEFPQT